MDLDLLSLCTLVPEAPCSVVYALRSKNHKRFHANGMGFAITLI